MADHRSQAIQFAHQNRERFLGNLKQLVSIPSVSTNPQNEQDMHRAANWIASYLNQIGINQVQIMPTGGHPVVYGEWLNAGKEAPVVLVYGHYDVQPSQPDDLWKTPPFVPTVIGDNLYGRGASDMKGQIIATLSAIESILQQGSLPVNVKFIIEGEEEIGSPHLAPFISGHQDLLASTVALNPDAGMIAADVPTIVYSLRGLAYFELRVYGPEHDLHSGLYGGVIYNPAQALCELIAGMHDEQGRVTLPGFYDHVRDLSEEERRELARLPMDEQYYCEQTGVPCLWGEAGYTPNERIGARPTLEVNGLYSGYTDKGSKTVLPAYAMAKISMRLVPDQEPEEIERALQNYLMAKAPQCVRWELETMQGGPACMTDPHIPEAEALAKALETVWGIRPVYKREGGSIPVVSDMQETLGIKSVLTGFGLPDDNLHAPNEKLHLPTWYKGIDALINFFYNLEVEN